MKRIFKSLLVLSMSMSLILNQGQVLETEAAEGYNLPAKVEDGAMFHAYLWKFKDIEKSLKTIAEAGYNAIQVSPVQGTKGVGQWYLMYQPCNYNIGNTQLGDYNDFKDLCTIAERDYGIKIIVDVVLNHIADNGQSGQWSDAIDNTLKRSELYHNKGTCDNYTDRYSVTQENLGNGPDLATQREDVQNMHIDFLNKCIDAGADGFRFDAAKHIETNIEEDAWKSWSGNYWDKVLGSLKNKDKLYLYGEVLPDIADNSKAYLKYYDITAHQYGQVLRDAVYSKNLNGILNVKHGAITLLPEQSLAYIENHDNYEHNETKSMGAWERKMTYGILASRAKIATLFLDRPEDDLWKDKEVVSVNKFRNAMIGQGEYIRIIRNETAMIERGTKGVSIVNLGGEFNLDSQTNLADGTYTNKNGNQTFKVLNGKITGNVPAGQIVVLYNEESNLGGGESEVKEVVKISSDAVQGKNITITYNANGRPTQNSSQMKIHWGYDGWKGTQDTVMTKAADNSWSVTLLTPVQAQKQLDFVFTNGKEWDNNCNSNWSVKVVADNQPILVTKEVDVKFTVKNASTVWGQNVYIVGNIKELGEWTTSKAIKLSAKNYPNWEGTIKIPANTEIVFKAIKINESGKVEWLNGSDIKVKVGSDLTQNIEFEWK